MPERHSDVFTNSMSRIQPVKREILVGIAKSVGTPLKFDGNTLHGMVGYYDRILIEIDMLHTLQSSVMIDRGDTSFFVDLHYESLPLFCNECKIVGHSTSKCRKLNASATDNDLEGAGVLLTGEGTKKGELPKSTKDWVAKSKEGVAQAGSSSKEGVAQVGFSGENRAHFPVANAFDALMELTRPPDIVVSGTDLVHANNRNEEALGRRFDEIWGGPGGDLIKKNHARECRRSSGSWASDCEKSDGDSNLHEKFLDDGKVEVVKYNTSESLEDLELDRGCTDRLEDHEGHGISEGVREHEGSREDTGMQPKHVYKKRNMNTAAELPRSLQLGRINVGRLRHEGGQNVEEGLTPYVLAALANMEMVSMFGNTVMAGNVNPPRHDSQSQLFS
ncbi:hypothetical protein C2S52_001020 [Perilla frutescens var. hirtella]|nr:hypothetical protein C2S52_001020 [Perilla frutescens var. hirtella]